MTEQPSSPLPRRPSDNSRSATIAGLAVLAVFFGGLGGWAAIGQLDHAVIAPGVIVVEGNRIALAHRDGGTVAEVVVREGALVAEGELLVRLDTNELSARVDLLEVRLHTAQARAARLTAERTDAREIKFSDELLARATQPLIASVLIQEIEVFQARRTALAGNLAILEQQIAGQNQDMAALDARRRAQVTRIESAGQQLRQLTELYGPAHFQVLELQREVALAEGERDGLAAQSARAEESVRETRLRIDQLRKQRSEETANGLREATDQIRAVEPELIAARQSLQRAEIRAPVAGSVLGLSAISRGSVVRPGEHVLDIVPQGGKLVVEARISPDDIETIRTGLAAQVRLTSYRYPSTPVLKASVAVISADRMVDERSGFPYYRAQVALLAGEIEGAGVEVMPGLPAEVTIAVGARTPLSYFLDPLLNTLRRSGHEE